MVLPFLSAIAPFAPLIGGVVSGLGQLFAPKPKAQTVTNSIDLKKLRADAEEAGFNPLTIIRGGGLAGYGSQTIPAGPDMRLSNAFQTFGSALAQWDPFGVERSRLEVATMERDLRSLRRVGVSSNLSIGGVPVARGVTDATSPRMFGWNIPVDTGFSDAELYEQRWGELGGSVMGVVNLGADLVKASGFNASPGWAPLVEGLNKAATDFDKWLRPERYNTYTTGGGF